MTKCTVEWEEEGRERVDKEESGVKGSGIRRSERWNSWKEGIIESWVGVCMGWRG